MQDGLTSYQVYKIIRQFVNFSSNRICVHNAALQLLGALEANGQKIDGSLAKALVQSDDEKALEILKGLIK